MRRLKPHDGKAQRGRLAVISSSVEVVYMSELIKFGDISDTTQFSHRGKTEMLRGLGNFLSKDRPDHCDSDCLKVCAYTK